MFDMNTKKVGFIGGGQMAYAVAMGLVKGGAIPPERVHVSNRTKTNLEMFSIEGIHTTQDNMEVLKMCDIVFLAVKPYVFPVIVAEFSERGGGDFGNKIFVSLMGGVEISSMEDVFGKGSKVIRTMPNTPCLAGAGTIMICKGQNITDQEFNSIQTFLSSCAECFECKEELLSPASGVMGCAPAYMFVAIEALADGGVMHGLPRPLALKLASRAVMGAGKLAYESDKHPEQLKDAVASPKGTTIRGLHALEKGGFRATLIDAVVATCAP